MPTYFCEDKFSNRSFNILFPSNELFGMSFLKQISMYFCSQNIYFLLFSQKTVFPKVFGEFQYLIETVCEGIEDQFGRLNLKMVEKSEFMKNRNKFHEMKSKHYNENIECLQLIEKSDSAGNCFESHSSQVQG